MRVGDIVRVKPNIKDPEFGIDIAGWQGRVSEISPQEKLILIEWDSLTLVNMPDEIIAQSEEKGLDWSQMYLDLNEVEPGTVRDTEGDVTETISKIEAEHVWDYLGKEGRNISKVLVGVSRDDEWGAYQAWEAHLRQVLQFPFEARVSEMPKRSSQRVGDWVVVQGITEVVDSYGIIVAVRYKRRRFYFPLCNLEVIDKGSANYDFVREYAVWFANH